VEYNYTKNNFSKSYFVASNLKNDINMPEDDALNNAKQGNIYTHSMLIRVELSIEIKGIPYMKNRVSPYCNIDINI